MPRTRRMNSTVVMSGNAPSTTMMSGMSPMHMEIASNPVAASDDLQVGAAEDTFRDLPDDGRIVDEQAALHVPVPKWRHAGKRSLGMSGDDSAFA